ncbi:PAS domain-containing sensor histidine kinase [Alteromonadaceae bacterium M269]|nr:PAS domain-containing sensor histidine kinase [Alteromonadaceae bacterium M269]
MTHSFEAFLKSRYGFIVVVLIALCSWIINLASLDFLEGLTLALLVIAPCIYWCWQTYNETMKVITGVNLQLDAMSNEEYNAWYLTGFKQGAVKELKNDVSRLTTHMQASQEALVQHEAILLSVLKQLAIPIVIMDSHARIYFANSGFMKLVGKEQQVLIGRFGSEFGLNKRDEQWHFVEESSFAAKYRLYENHIVKNHRRLDILLCFSVEQTLRENEKLVWQRLLRVLNHEVRNSLTPITSIAQSLQEMHNHQQGLGNSHELLSVIEKRAQYLLQFVDGYSAFNNIQKPNKQLISSEFLEITLTSLNPRVKVTVNDKGDLYADEGQLQQVLINMIKNASEADCSNNPIEVVIDGDASTHFIHILDQGEGIQNAENLFTPFYSTKQEGNGIGLVLSRELMRQQGGDLTLCSRKDIRGAECILTLPKQKRSW